MDNPFAAEPLRGQPEDDGATARLDPPYFAGSREEADELREEEVHPQYGEMSQVGPSRGTEADSGQGPMGLGPEMREMFALDAGSSDPVSCAAELGSQEATGAREPERFNIASEPDELVPDYNSFPSSASGQPSTDGQPATQSGLPQTTSSLVAQMGTMFQTLLAQQVGPMMSRLDRLETQSRQSSGRSASMQSAQADPSTPEAARSSVFQPLDGMGVWQGTQASGHVGRESGASGARETHPAAAGLSLNAGPTSAARPSEALSLIHI